MISPHYQACWRDMKRLIAVLTLAALAPIAPAEVATAQTYPTRPITMNVPFAAGGPTDTIARVIAQRMSAVLGQSIIIENVTGADGTIGVGRVARAAPDGYLLSVGQWSTHVLNGAAYALPYDLLKDFEPVALMATNPLVIVSYKGVPAANLKETDRLAQGEPRARRRGHRLDVAPGQRCLFPEPHRGEVYARTLSRRRARHAGHDGGPDHDDVRPGRHVAAAGARRQHEALRGHGRDAA